MATRFVKEGNAFYEIDEDCLLRKGQKEDTKQKTGSVKEMKKSVNGKQKIGNSLLSKKGMP